MHSVLLAPSCAGSGRLQTGVMVSESLALVYLSLAKWLTYLGFLGLTGAVAGELWVRPRAAFSVGRREEILGAVSDRFCGVAYVSVGLLLVATVARLYAQTYSAFGVEEPVTGELVRVVALESRWGELWMPQVVVTIMAIVSAGVIRLHPDSGWQLSALSVLGLMVTLPMTGHAMASPDDIALAMTLQPLHGLAAGVWLGTLAAIVAAFVVLRGPGGEEVLASLVHAFSPMAVGAVALLLATGVSTAYLYTDNWVGLFASTWGRLLALKTLLVLLTCVLGAYHWRLLRPRLGTEPARATFRRTARLELALAAAVLLVTSVLVHLPKPHE
jgi:copper transport protein